MKNLSEGQYERIGRLLDGEDVELSAEERQVAEEIRRDEAGLASAIEAARPRVSLNRARRRMIAALARPRVRPLRIGALAAAAVAAAVVLTVLLSQPKPQPRTPTLAPATLQPAAKIDAAFVTALEELAAEDELDLIEQDVHELGADIAASSVPLALELEIDALEQRVEELYLDYLPSAGPLDSEG
ncbi:MAG: hypothetical protein ACYTF6_09050 [Planctomycetota bacterium]|jgi:hypothetical protein